MKAIAVLLLLCCGLSTQAAETVAAPAPTEDRVNFPTNYASRFEILRTVFRTNEQKVVTIYGNTPASFVKQVGHLPYPLGSVLVMETALTSKDPSGQAIVKADGTLEKGQVTGLHVMRKEIGFGTAYRTNQAGIWEFVEYAPDGSFITPPSKSAVCAECHRKAGVEKDYVFQARVGGSISAPNTNKPSESLRAKAVYFEKDLLEKHWLEGLYISIVPAIPTGQPQPHTVDQPGNVIHSGVWTGRYLGGVGYQYAITQDPAVRQLGGKILQALRIQQEVTGKAGLLARGYVKGHGPVEEWEREGRDSIEWHQGQGKYSDYRWYGDVSVDNFNAILYGYAIYYDLAADAAQKAMIANDVNRLMTHLLENHCRIIDVDGEVTLWGHVGIDPDPSFDEYYRQLYATRFNRREAQDRDWKPSLRSSLMLLPDLLIAEHITGEGRYREFYDRVVARFRDNPDRRRNSGAPNLQRLARIDHSTEGQAYEALYNLIRFERDPALLQMYRKWTEDLWEANWMEGNSLFTWMTRALLPEYRAPSSPGVASTPIHGFPHGTEGTSLALATLRLFPINRAFTPVMNSLLADIEKNPFATNEILSARPLPVNQRPLDNEYTWKGNPYQMDGWLKPVLTSFQSSCDDPQIAWCSDSSGRLFLTRDGGVHWQDVTEALRGAHVQRILASAKRTFVIHAQTDQGVFLSRDGGMSWRPTSESVVFPEAEFSKWQSLSSGLQGRIGEHGEMLISTDRGTSERSSMAGWRVPRTSSVFGSAIGLIASGPGGCYRTWDGENWAEVKVWPEYETGAADYLHAYWMGRYYGYIGAEE